MKLKLLEIEDGSREVLVDDPLLLMSGQHSRVLVVLVLVGAFAIQ